MIFHRKNSSKYVQIVSAIAFLVIVILYFIEEKKLSFLISGCLFLALYYIVTAYHYFTTPLFKIDENVISYYEFPKKKVIEIKNLVSIKYLAGDYSFEDKSGKIIRIIKSIFRKEEIDQLERKIQELESHLESETETSSLAHV